VYREDLSVGYAEVMRKMSASRGVTSRRIVPEHLYHIQLGVLLQEGQLEIKGFSVMTDNNVEG